MRVVERLDDRRLDLLEPVLEVDGRDRRLEQGGQHVAAARDPVQLAAGDVLRLLERGTPPRSSSFATPAQLWRETTWARIFARRPSDASGKRS